MSRLTITEKEHWKSRIENRINKAIEIVEIKDPTLMSSIKEKAITKAHKELGTTDLHAKIEAGKRSREALSEEETKLSMAMYAKAFGRVPKPHESQWQLEGEFSRLINKHSSRIEDELLQASKIGKEIVRLRVEKDALLDTVWLATSSIQIRELWSRVSEAIGDEATELQRRILAEDASSCSSD